MIARFALLTAQTSKPERSGGHHTHDANTIYGMKLPEKCRPPPVPRNKDQRREWVDVAGAQRR